MVLRRTCILDLPISMRDCTPSSPTVSKRGCTMWASDWTALTLIRFSSNWDCMRSCTYDTPLRAAASTPPAQENVSVVPYGMTERRPARKRWTGAPRVASVARWPLKIRGALQAALQIPRALQIQSMSFVFSLSWR
ncbi:hypothetical protein VPH35_083417 [Triticum aestivum]